MECSLDISKITVLFIQQLQYIQGGIEEGMIKYEGAIEDSVAFLHRSEHSWIFFFLLPFPPPSFFFLNKGCSLKPEYQGPSPWGLSAEEDF